MLVEFLQGGFLIAVSFPCEETASQETFAVTLLFSYFLINTERDI